MALLPRGNRLRCKIVGLRESTDFGMEFPGDRFRKAFPSERNVQQWQSDEAGVHGTVIALPIWR